MERAPALKEELNGARDHAEVQMGKAAAIILQEVADNREGHRRYLRNMPLQPGPAKDAAWSVSAISYN